MINYDNYHQTLLANQTNPEVFHRARASDPYTLTPRKDAQGGRDDPLWPVDFSHESHLLMFDGLFIWVSHGLSENGV